MKSRGLGIFITSLCLFAVSWSVSSSVEGVLASVKTTGMAATGIAYPQDAEAGAFNPAGMADVGNRFDVGVTYDRPRRFAHVFGNQIPFPGINGKFDAGRTKNFFVADFGVNYEIPTTCYCSYINNVSLGMYVYNRNFNKTTYRNPLPLLGTSKLGMEYVHETASGNIAVKVADIHNFGLSINWMIQRLSVKGIQNFDNPVNSAHPGHVTNRGYSYAQGCGVTLGYRCQLLDWISIGATYQPKTQMSRFKKYSGFLAQNGRLDIPTKIGGGIAIRFLPNATAAVDVEYIGWRYVRALNNPILPGLVTSQLGRKDGPGFGFRSQVFYRVGVDYDITDNITVRAGYRFANTPIRRTQTAVNLLIVDTVESYLTLGASWCINENTEASFFYAHGFNKEVRGRNSIPPFLGGGEVNLREFDDAVGIQLGVAY
jgi:long-chain fatty acid transport protein